MIQLKTIYGITAFVLGISILANGWNLFTAWSSLNLASKFAVLFGNIIFQLMILVTFAVMYKITPAMPKVAVIENPDLDNLLNDLSKKYKEE